MAGLQIYCNSTLTSKDELAGNALRAFNKGSSIFNPTFPLSCTFTLILVLISAFAQGSPGIYANVNL